MICSECNKAFDGERIDWDLIDDRMTDRYDVYVCEWLVTCPHCNSNLLVTDKYRMVTRDVHKSEDAMYELPVVDAATLS